VIVSKQFAKPAFDSVYRSYFGEVSRWVRALGTNDGDIEDVTQEVFIIVRRKYSSFDGRDVRAFLYRIAQRTVRDHRRSAWFRNLCGRRSPLPEFPCTAPSGLDALDEQDRRKVLDSILARMTEKRRTTFILFEVEGYSGEEIAEIQSLPVKTVWTRLHHARKDFLRMVSEVSGGQA
jgi:RNA polymerase sigma-70 factor (ECF subfamily)